MSDRKLKIPLETYITRFTIFWKQTFSDFMTADKQKRNNQTYTNAFRTLRIFLLNDNHTTIQKSMFVLQIVLI